MNQDQVTIIIKRLEQEYPDAKILLKYTNNWELLVATVLSAQCTDRKVNEVTEKLFAKYPDIDAYAQADPLVFEQDIRPTGFFRNKTKNILTSARLVTEKFNGEVPRTMAELLTLPGVARKTANIILGNAFGIVEGIAVDTHVKRLSNRIGLANSDIPEKIEQELMAIIPRAKWFLFTYLLIEHGRAVCIAIRPKCADCIINDLCESAFRVK